MFDKYLGQKFCCWLRIIQTTSAGQPLTLPVGTRRPFCGSKVAGIESWLHPFDAQI